MSENTELVDKSLEILKDRLKGEDIGIDNIMKIVKLSMEVVEVTALKGVEQKNLCVLLVRRVVEDAPITDDKEKLLLDMIDSGILGNTIDLVVAATKGELGLNDVLTVAAGCCASFFKKTAK